MSKIFYFGKKKLRVNGFIISEQLTIYNLCLTSVYFGENLVWFHFGNCDIMDFVFEKKP